MTREEKQDLFIKKLYLLSHKHIDETSEERLAYDKLPPPLTPNVGWNT
jgi:hypothetical protein